MIFSVKMDYKTKVRFFLDVETPCLRLRSATCSGSAMRAIYLKTQTQALAYASMYIGTILAIYLINSKMMKKFGLSLFGLLSSLAMAQVAIGTSETSASNNKITYGGSIGFSSVSGGFGLSVSPRLGYRLSQDVEMGLMGSYHYINNSAATWNNVAIGPFANYYLLPQLYASAMYQHIFLNASPKSNQNIGFSKQEDALYFGGGYMSRLGSNSFMQIGLLYNVLWDKNSSSPSAFLPQAGVVFGF
jgi:hypothetical protein